MAATKSAKNPTSGNDTPNTPGVSESAIAAMKVGELRRRLRDRGVKGTAELKKAELVKKLVRLETGGAKSGGSSGKKSEKETNRAATTPSRKKSSSIATTKASAAALKDRSAAKKLASAAGKLPTTKKLLFAQTDPPSDDIPTTSEVDDSQDTGSRGMFEVGDRTDQAVFHRQ